MAHFAKLGLGFEVTAVVVVDNKNILNDKGVEVEQLGIDYLSALTGYPFWKQSSYNSNFRMKQASFGDVYNVELDCFHAKKAPFPSWGFSDEARKWEAPAPYPEDDKDYVWVELTKQWVLHTDFIKRDD